jgi:hypothetical protein
MRGAGMDRWYGETRNQNNRGTDARSNLNPAGISTM